MVGVTFGLRHDLTFRLIGSDDPAEFGGVLWTAGDKMLCKAFGWRLGLDTT